MMEFRTIEFKYTKNRGLIDVKIVYMLLCNHVNVSFSFRYTIYKESL